MKAQLLFVHALSPLHPGTGQGVGVIDLPVAREQATGLPYLPGSSLKGVLRERCQETDSNNCVPVFGPDTDRADEHAGAAHFSDQRLLLLPVRSLKGTFAWVTSPYLLRRFKRDADSSGVSDFPAVPDLAKESRCIVSSASSALLHNPGQNQKVILEDLDLSAEVSDDAKSWADELAKRIFPSDEDWKQTFSNRFCIVHDDVLSFLQQTAMEVVARIRLQDDSKTVAEGGLWYEEALPAETVLTGVVLAAPVAKTGLSNERILEVISNVASGVLQLGGNATVGRGLCRVLMSGGE
jgi:CRISPR-associated protein Cmr4